MSGAHSILPPSGAAAWRRCGLWVAMNQAYPKPDTPESMEGNAAHWVFAEMLAGRIVCEGLIAPNGVVVTEEMIEGGDLVVETVRARIPVSQWRHVEEPVTIGRVHPDCWGTPDIWAFTPFPPVLEVIDYKFGHRFVDEFENDQGIAYIAGLIERLADEIGEGPGLFDQRLKVNFTVIQPRCFYKGSPVRTWSVMASELRGHINALTMAADIALAPNPPAVTNSECGDCPGRHACPALQKAAYYDAEFAVKSSPVELPPAAASLELKMLERSLERLQSRVEGMREAVGAYIRQGHSVPWHRAEQGYGRQQWTMPVDQVLAMGSLMGVDLSKPGVKTPKQAVKSGVDEAVIKAYSVTPLGSIKLVPDNPADARRVFGTST
ncbi:MAG: DUF2800 domain-containing protein [Kiritimatiellia bacterium]